MEDLEDPVAYGCIYCGVHDLLYKWEGDGPMCLGCIGCAKEQIAEIEADDDN